MWELPDIQGGFKKSRWTRHQIAYICWIIGKARGFQENTYFWYIYYAKTFHCGSQQTGKFLKRWEYQTTWPASWETCVQIKREELESYKEQCTGSKLGKEYFKAVYCHPAYLTYMQSTSCKMPGLLKHKLESNLPGEISTTSEMQMSHCNSRKWRGTKEPDYNKKGEWKGWLKTQHSKS